MIFNFFRYECYCQPGYYGVNCQIPPTTLCPTDEGNYLEIDGQCFYFETQNLGYPEAKANCAKNKFSGGGRLFEPMTLAENEKICKTFADLLGTVACIIVRHLLISVHKWQSSGMAATHEYWSQHDAHLVYLPIFHGLNLIIFS